MFRELFRTLPDIEITGEPDYLQSSFIHGIKRMPCRVHPSLSPTAPVPRRSVRWCLAHRRSGPS